MKTRIIITLFALVIIFVPLTSHAIEYPGDPPGTSEERETWFEQLRQNIAAQMPYTIHGRVVDQNGDPVVGADVRVGWHYISLPLLELKTGKEWLTTDSNGVFSHTITRGNSPDVFELNKKGYEWNRHLSPDFDRKTDEEIVAMFSNSQDPLTFIMRKKEVPTYLYHEQEFQWYSELPSETVSYNIIKRGLKSIDSDISLLKNPEKVDLVFQVTHDSQNNQYTFKAIAPLGTNGLLLDENKLYTAPSEGYSSEVVITLSRGQEMEKYLYFKSRNLEYEAGTGKEYKPIYSRMKLEFRARDNSLKFYYDTWTNPYGSPNLEYEPDMPFDLRNELRLEAKEAIKSGKLPPEPNLQEMMASGQYN